MRRLELADIDFDASKVQDKLNKVSSLDHGRCSRHFQFVREHIKMDGVFVLKMLTIHAGISICTEVSCIE